MNYNILVILLLIIIIFFYFNKMLFSNNNNINNNNYNINNNEHFTELLDVFNNLMNYTNKSSIIKNKNSISNNNINENKNENNLKDKYNIKDIVVKHNNNIESLFKKNIFVIYNKESHNTFELYFYNYKNQLYLKCKIKNNTFLIVDKNNKEIGNLINNMYQTYKFSLKELYEEDIFYFSFLKDYNTIKIYPENKTYNLYIKKYVSSNIKNEHIVYSLYYFEKEIGYIYINNKNYKIELFDKYKNLLNLFGIGIALIIKMQ
jgi:hypothetical protein